MRGRDGGGDFFLAHRDVISARALETNSSPEMLNLHVVDALAAAEAHRLADFRRPVGDHAEAFGVHVLLALVAEAAGDGDLGAGGAVARAGEIAVLDLLADDDIDAELRARRPSRRR